MNRSDIAVIGAGLAGAVLVRRLLQAGETDIAWFDAGGHAASDVPCALVHPFAGRSFAPRPGVFAAWRAARAFLDTMAGPAKVHRAPVCRIVGPHEAGRRLVDSWHRHRAEIEASFDGEPPVWDPAEGTIEYGPGYAFDPAAAVAVLKREAVAGGARLLATTVQRIEAADDGWRIVSTTPHAAHHVVVAAGAGSRALLSPWADVAALQRFEGKLVHAPGPPLARFVIDRGHVASTASRIAWGSSYRALEGEDPRLPVDQLAAIEERLRPHCPGLPALAGGQTWTGVRLVRGPHRRPWVETVRPGLHVMTAFGSQGGLWIPYFADALARGLEG